ncbi:hypothetical protein ACIPVK_08050 [Paeniglutamicibacter sp. MACA_103]|uniref:hypothetical protein n=1 Tax=Paeniglutamicibacter sp. MACA_103 TaxID=3377337 RepID=UPI003893FF92
MTETSTPAKPLPRPSSSATESVAYEYSRHNCNVAQLFSPDRFRSSDHDPVLVGLQLDK